MEVHYIFAFGMMEFIDDTYSNKNWNRLSMQPVQNTTQEDLDHYITALPGEKACVDNQLQHLFKEL